MIMNLSKLYSNRGNHSLNKSNIALLNKSSSQKRTQKYNQDRRGTHPTNATRHYNNHVCKPQLKLHSFSPPLRMPLVVGPQDQLKWQLSSDHLIDLDKPFTLKWALKMTNVVLFCMWWTNHYYSSVSIWKPENAWRVYVR